MRNIFLIVCSLIVLIASLSFFPSQLKWIMHADSASAIITSARCQNAMPRKFIHKRSDCNLGMEFLAPNKQIISFDESIYVRGNDIDETRFIGSGVDVLYQIDNFYDAYLKRRFIYGLITISIFFFGSLFLLGLSLFRLKRHLRTRY